MKFTSEIIKETGTILAFTCTKIPESPVFLYASTVLLTLLGFFLKQAMIIFPIIYLISNYRNAVIKETLYIIKGLGLQITKFTRAGSSSNLFIDSNEIREVIINETLSPYDVQIRLGIILTKSTKLIVPFEGFEISLTQAKQVYQGVRGTLLS
ncbi:hypothetical protein SteCoe_1324 [Stentor coeruleus]|uniref:Phosphatidylinositol N-acetylglucosaminyltransferase subunit H conserved domain-containing protein n=1 Tax=Stentor coeruleus TaxID=5963 RepID=A0A1R2D207_9CILI|nr:hypothetical protein SteCoe_1324 [Stentor coeruleus]